MKYLLIFLAILILNTPNARCQKTPVKINGYAQGTTYSITYFDKKTRNFQPEIEKILQDFNKSVSLWDSGSIISKINANRQNVLVDKYFSVCFEKATEVSVSTGGIFDATVGPLVNYWGFGLKNRSNTDSSGVDSILKFVGYQLIELQNSKIIKKDDRVKIDFNGLAQGYSTDLISEFLESKGISSYIVEIGGEVYANNKKPNGDFWNVGIETPNDHAGSDNPLYAVAKLKNMALSTSGSYRKYYVVDGRKYSHAINPYTGFPAMNNLLSVSVFAPDCITADAYATAFMVMGVEETKIFLTKHPELMVYMISSGASGQFEIYESPGLKEIINRVE